MTEAIEVVPYSALPVPSPAPGERLLSLDALRGFDMFWIISGEGLIKALYYLATKGGTQPTDHGFFYVLAQQFEHSEWRGVTFYDLIFPLFVFLVGVSLVLSLSKAMERGGKKAAVGRVIRRGLILFAFGIIYYGGFQFDDKEHPDIRYLGVLQRIAICYLAAGLLFVFLKPKPLLGVLIGLLVVYWALMSFVPFPGRGEDKFAEAKNLADWLDSKYLPGYKWEPHDRPEQKFPRYDPEGLLSTLPAIGTCLLGVFAGLLLRNMTIQPAMKVLYLFGGGAALVGLGMLWGMQFPIIKKLWTSSYVLVAGGYSAIALGLFYLIIDVAKLRAWATPFVWIGMNPITLYMIDRLVNFDRFAERFVGGPVQARLHEFGPLVASIVAVSFALLTAWFLYRKKIFLRV